jgi:hypothetical protein
MQFGDFIWPSNPSEIEIRCAGNDETFPVSFEPDMPQDFGQNPLRIRGKGVFFGETAGTDFASLRRLFDRKKKGLLMVPGLEPIVAVPRVLTVTDAGKPGQTAYSFEFTEIQKEQAEPCVFEKRIVLGEGETLWHTAAAHDVPIETLMRLNPEKKDPWDVLPGDEVRVG